MVSVYIHLNICSSTRVGIYARLVEFFTLICILQSYVCFGTSLQARSAEVLSVRFS